MPTVSQPEDNGGSAPASGTTSNGKKKSDKKGDGKATPKKK